MLPVEARLKHREATSSWKPAVLSVIPLAGGYLAPATVHTHIYGGWLPVTGLLLWAGGQGRSRSLRLCRRS